MAIAPTLGTPELTAVFCLRLMLSVKNQQSHSELFIQFPVLIMAMCFMDAFKLAGTDTPSSWNNWRYLKLRGSFLMIIKAGEILERTVPRNNYSLLSDFVKHIYCMWLSTIEFVMLMAFSLITSWFLCTPEFMLLYWWCPCMITMWFTTKNFRCRWENNNQMGIFSGMCKRSYKWPIWVEIKFASKLGAAAWRTERIFIEINSYLWICEFLCVLILYLHKLNLTTLNYIEAVFIDSWGKASACCLC